MIRKDVFDAVSNIIKNDGFSKLSINQIAEAADMETVVIYRNFNNLENILEQYIERFDFWLSYFAKDKRKDIQPTKEYYKDSLTGLLEMVHPKREIQQLLIWELTEDSFLTNGMSQRRELAGENFINKYTEMFEGSGFDVRVVSAILISAIYYLSMYKNHSTFCGASMKGKEGRRILNDNLNEIIDLVFAKVDKTKEKEMARKMLEENIPMATVMSITGLTEKEIQEDRD
jgi:AcrR family transcriptional regulator